MCTTISIFIGLWYFLRFNVLAWSRKIQLVYVGCCDFFICRSNLKRTWRLNTSVLGMSYYFGHSDVVYHWLVRLLVSRHSFALVYLLKCFSSVPKNLKQASNSWLKNFLFVFHYPFIRIRSYSSIISSVIFSGGWALLRVSFCAPRLITSVTYYYLVFLSPLGFELKSSRFFHLIYWSLDYTFW